MLAWGSNSIELARSFLYLALAPPARHNVISSCQLELRKHREGNNVAELFHFARRRRQQPRTTQSTFPENVIPISWLSLAEYQKRYTCSVHVIVMVFARSPRRRSSWHDKYLFACDGRLLSMLAFLYLLLVQFYICDRDSLSIFFILFCGHATFNLIFTCETFMVRAFSMVEREVKSFRLHRQRELAEEVLNSSTPSRSLPCHLFSASQNSLRPVQRVCSGTLFIMLKSI